MAATIWYNDHINNNQGVNSETMRMTKFADNQNRVFSRQLTSGMEEATKIGLQIVEGKKVCINVYPDSKIWIL